MRNMITVTEFNPAFVRDLPDTYELLRLCNLVVRPEVTRITVHGSRGPAGGYQDDSDVDLSLIVHTSEAKHSRELETLLRDSLDTTLRNWQGTAELDLAAVFDKRGCGRRCFEMTDFDDNLCETVVDCLGIYKTQKGFNGFVEGPAVQVRAMYPCMIVWDKKPRRIAQQQESTYS